MSILPDPVLALLQLLPFLALMGGLHAILFKPMLAYLHERDRATVGARKEAEDLASKAEARLVEYEAALAAARNEVAEYKAARRADSQKAWQDAVAVVRKDADVRISAAVKEIQAGAVVARGQLDATAKALAGEIASSVLGRNVAVEA